VKTVVHDGKVNPAAPPGAPFFASQKYRPALAELIEPALVYEPSTGRWRKQV
jgi:hypothetical protein